MAEEKNRTLQKAREKMDYLTGDAAVRRLAELREIWELDYNSDINYAKDEGRIEAEHKKSMEIAKKLLKLQMPIEQISEITNLTEEEIKNMK